ncbi:MAG: GspE/PulE family protein [Gaiellaceae bacterium]|jgi:type IV pilus assembly protein PilB
MEASRLPWMQVGSLLIRENVVTSEQLTAALAEKDQTGRRVGDILVEHGWATTADLARALAEQWNLEFIDILQTEIEPEVSKLLSEPIVRRYRALPIRYLSKNLVLVAISDPTDILGLDSIKLALGVNLEFCLADSFDLERTIDQIYSQRPTLRVIDESTEADGEEDEQRLDLSAEVSDSSPAVSLANQVIAQAIEDRASDIHFEPQEKQMIVRVRVDGVTRELASVPKTMQQAVISRLKVMAQLDIADRSLPQDGRAVVKLAGDPVDLRVAVLPTTHGEKVVVRILQRSSTHVSLPDLGMSEQAYASFVHAVDQPFGCVIACGPTGAGKTTTLYAALDRLNSSERVITTIEDPVEYELNGISQIQINPKRGLDFARGLRTILRADPDVLLVGEIRDGETAQIAVQAAMTGHLVLSTVHAQTAAGSFARLQDMGLEPFMLANAINCVVSQRLVRVLCPSCRAAAEPTDAERAELSLSPETPAVLHHPVGCRSCSDTGYHGRTGVYEVLPVTAEIRKLIGQSTEEIHEAAVRGGMIGIREDGYRLVLAGVTSLEEVRRVVGNGSTQ